MILLTDLMNDVLTETGQFLIDVNNIELDRARFNTLVRKSLRQFSRYLPEVRKFNKEIDGFHTFLADTIDGIPDAVSKAVPITSSKNPFGSLGGFGRFKRHVSQDFTDKGFAAMDYRKPKLYVPFKSLYDITATYCHTIKTDTSGDDYIDTIEFDDEPLFMDLLNGYFLRSIALSRRAFTLNPLEISTDSDTLKVEADEMVREALIVLQENVDFSTAWG